MRGAGRHGHMRSANSAGKLGDLAFFLCEQSYLGRSFDTNTGSANSIVLSITPIALFWRLSNLALWHFVA